MKKLALVKSILILLFPSVLLAQDFEIKNTGTDRKLVVSQQFKGLIKSLNPSIKWIDGREIPQTIHESFASETNQLPHAIIEDINGDGKKDLAVLAQKLDQEKNMVISIYQSSPKGYTYREIKGLGPKDFFMQKNRGIIGTSDETGFRGYLTIRTKKLKKSKKSKNRANGSKALERKVIGFENWGSMVSQNFLILSKRIKPLHRW